jgi:hypothetical protein
MEHKVKRQVFYSFHYGNDAMRVQQIRNMGILEGNEPVSPNDWEQVKRNGHAAIKKWIDDNMRNRSCVIVLIGEETANRHWVQYEIEKAWKEKKAIMGIYIHNLKDPKTGTCKLGINPFSLYTVNGRNLSELIPCHNPNPMDAYNDIKKNLSVWIEKAIQRNLINMSLYTNR